MAYDTALAQLTMNSSDDNIPREFVAKEAINLVYDNIDFQEDIKEQTHVTNEIITQKIAGKNPSASNRREGVKKSQRSLPIGYLAVYYRNEKDAAFSGLRQNTNDALLGNGTKT